MRTSLLGGLVQAMVIVTAGRLVGELLIENIRLRAGQVGLRRVEGRRVMDRTMAGRMALTPPITPLGAVARGLVAGAAGSLVQTAFFRATARLAPPTPEGIFSPPEEMQLEEEVTQTVARRVVEGLMHRGPIRDKPRAGEVVHYAYSAAWGGVYGLIRGTTPAIATPAGVLAFGTTVWALSDTVILPAFQLTAGPRAYHLRNHLYAWAAHVAYAAGVWAALEAQRRATWIPVVAALSARWTTRRLPAPLRPPATRILTAVRSHALGARLRATGRAAAASAVARAE